MLFRFKGCRKVAVAMLVVDGLRLRIVVFVVTDMKRTETYVFYLNE